MLRFRGSGISAAGRVKRGADQAGGGIAGKGFRQGDQGGTRVRVRQSGTGAWGIVMGETHGQVIGKQADRATGEGGAEQQQDNSTETRAIGRQATGAGARARGRAEAEGRGKGDRQRTEGECR